ncbi:MAG: hypothetical protein D6740_09565, partial [Alphaproteobacteria bacterium]
SPVGDEETIVTALADEAGADAWLARLAPLITDGLAEITITLRGLAPPIPFAPGDVLHLGSEAPGSLAGRDVLVTAVNLDLASDSVRLVTRGPLA